MDELLQLLEKHHITLKKQDTVFDCGIERGWWNFYDKEEHSLKLIYNIYQYKNKEIVLDYMYYMRDNIRFVEIDILLYFLLYYQKITTMFITFRTLSDFLDHDRPRIHYVVLDSSQPNFHTSRHPTPEEIAVHVRGICFVCFCHQMGFRCCKRTLEKQLRLPSYDNTLCLLCYCNTYLPNDKIIIDYVKQYNIQLTNNNLYDLACSTRQKFV